VQSDRHFVLLCRYVERNAFRAGLVQRAEQWRWGSLWRRVCGVDEQRKVPARWPVDRPRNWVQLVNRPMRESEQEVIGQRVKGCRPYGDAGWQSKTTGRLGLEHTFRNRGRPQKEKE
jgi:putative transposase